MTTSIKIDNNNDGLVSGYKNRHTHAHIRSTSVEVRNFKGADAQHGIIFVRNMFDGYQLLANSKFIGNSPNLGAGGFVKFKEGGKTINKWFDRSHPTGKSWDFIDGLKVNAEGPVHVRNVEFRDFYNEFTEMQSCNIRFNEEFRFLMGATSSVEGLSFEEDALRICSGGNAGIGSMTVHFRYYTVNNIYRNQTNLKFAFSVTSMVR